MEKSITINFKNQALQMLELMDEKQINDFVNGAVLAFIEKNMIVKRMAEFEEHMIDRLYSLEALNLLNIELTKNILEDGRKVDGLAKNVLESDVYQGLKMKAKLDADEIYDRARKDKYSDFMKKHSK